MVLGLALAAVGPAMAAGPDTPPVPAGGPPADKPAGEPPQATGQFQAVAFQRLVVRLPVGAVAVVQQAGMFCSPARTTTWPGGQTDWNIAPFKDPFRTAFTQAGLKVEGDPDNLFETQTASADYALGGIVTDLSERYCTPNVTAPAQKGEVNMSITWELYSRLQKQIIGTFTTTGAAQLPNATPGGLSVMLANAFQENVRQLAANNQLRTLLSGAPRSETDLVKPQQLVQIDMLGAASATARPVDATVASVVLIRSPAGEGSGVLISSDGYLLTAAHVVGDATEVKVRWSDGVETPAEVVRVAKGRDVALLKTDGRGRKPLALRRDEPTVGDPVFAVGSTMGDKFQSSVTKGVISADRVIDGYAFIQSDVTVGPGASGGPLLDSEGRVIGLTVSGIVNPLIPTGIHLFVPTRDAIDFLALDLK